MEEKEKLLKEFKELRDNVECLNERNKEEVGNLIRYLEYTWTPLYKVLVEGLIKQLKEREAEYQELNR